MQEGNAENVPNAELGGKDVKRYLPFSEGLRNCVAKPLAQLNLLTALAQLYGSFTFRLASEVTHCLLFDFCAVAGNRERCCMRLYSSKGILTHASKFILPYMLCRMCNIEM